MKKILIHPRTSLYIGHAIITADRILEMSGNLNVVIVADFAIRELYAVKLAKLIGAEIVTLPKGKQAKSSETAMQLIDQLFALGYGKDTLLIAMGGGVTTDLTSFVASIYMRGIPLILIPTTLLAVVDASIGGKTGIDTPYGKNLIGTFYNPKAIFADLDLLKTLPEKECFNGRAEILKMGLIRDVSLLEMNGQGQDINVILKAIEGKISVVEEDPREQGLRRILNFGHTIGHALEALADYQMPHGEAVALGCIVESHLSMSLGYLSEKDFKKILALYRAFPLILPKTYQRTTLLEKMAYDKKNAAGHFRFVLIDQMGHALPFEGNYCRAVSLCELESTLHWMESNYR